MKTIGREPGELRDFAAYLDRVGRDYHESGSHYTAADYGEAAQLARDLAELIEKHASDRRGQP